MRESKAKNRGRNPKECETKGHGSKSSGRKITSASGGRERGGVSKGKDRRPPHLTVLDSQNKRTPGAEATEIALGLDALPGDTYVRTSAEDISGWNRQRIVDALVLETYVEVETAELISREVEETVAASGIKAITAPLIRELVDAKLIEHGLESARRMHTRLGMPLYDVDQLIMSPNRENANVPHGPEGTNLTLAEHIKKEYALINVFSQQVADAHLKGDIHLHDLGFCDRPYCSGQSLEYVKKFGLHLPNSASNAKPAKHPEVLLAHMVKFSAMLQGHFAGAIGWDAVNIFFAPYLVGKSDEEIKQLAQMLVFEFSQQAVARGGQAIFSDLNIYWEIPKHFEDVPAIGPGGEYTGKTYSDYQEEAQKMAWALFSVYLEGDAAGRPFFFPKPMVHITEKFFKTPRYKEFLEHICLVAAQKGNTYFVFDRGDTAKISQCCRLSFKLKKDDINDAKHPWKMRYCALQNVSINLPRLGYQAEGDDARLFSLLADVMELAAQAHLEKLVFIERLLSHGTTGPLAMLAMKLDGEPYLRLRKATFLMGMVGLNELVEIHYGEEMHQSKRALMLGLRVISHMMLVLKKLSGKYKMNFVLEQTPAESTAYRFAKLDLRYYSPRSAAIVKGDFSRGEVYYTNSTLLNVGAPINALDRVRLEGLFHPLIPAGSISHIWLGETNPHPASLAEFVIQTFHETQNDQIAFSPEFTTCNKCYQTSRGTPVATVVQKTWTASPVSPATSPAPPPGIKAN